MNEVGYMQSKNLTYTIFPQVQFYGLNEKLSLPKKCSNLIYIDSKTQEELRISFLRNLETQTWYVLRFTQIYIFLRQVVK